MDTCGILLVDLVNELDTLAEDREQVLARVPERRAALIAANSNVLFRGTESLPRKKYFRRVLRPESFSCTEVVPRIRSVFL